MKQLLLILIFSFSVISFGQVNFIQISTNSNSIYVPWSPPTQFNGSNPYNSTTSDSGLNIILQNNNVTTVTQNYHNIDQTNSIFATYSGPNLSAFITDLQNYSSLVTKVSICPQFETFGDILYASLINQNIGNPIGFNNNIVVTTDNGLNTIFQNYNVNYFSGSMIQCTCNVADLKNDLINYNSVINPNYVGYAGLVFLSNDTFEKKLAIIYPNPFSDKFNINSDENITNYVVFDITGKQIINTNSKTELDNLTPQLNAGSYFLNLQTENGATLNYKLLKK